MKTAIRIKKQSHHIINTNLLVNRRIECFKYKCETMWNEPKNYAY